jgi:hypothetical protein
LTKIKADLNWSHLSHCRENVAYKNMSCGAQAALPGDHARVIIRLVKDLTTSLADKMGRSEIPENKMLNTNYSHVKIISYISPDNTVTN